MSYVYNLLFDQFSSALLHKDTIINNHEESILNLKSKNEDLQKDNQRLNQELELLKSELSQKRDQIYEKF